MKKSVIKVISFLTILCVLFSGFFRIYSFKFEDGIYGLQAFYQQKSHSIDVLFVGSSNIFENINTQVLWDNYGMASFDLAGSVQPIWNSYYYIKEALKTQSPQLIILDILSVTYTADYSDSSRIIKNTYGLRPSPDKINALKTSVPIEDNFYNYLLEFPTFHTRYSELTKGDFLPYSGTAVGENWKGFWINKYTNEYTTPEDFQTNEIGVLTEKVEKYLRLICELCTSNNIPLLLIKTPYQTSLQDTLKYNRAAEIAAEYDVPFINYNYYYDDIGLDFSHHFADNAHLNYIGNTIFTDYLAHYIKDNYEIPDRRGTPGYETYDIMAKDCLAKSYNASIEDTNDFSAYIETIQSPNYVVAYTLAGNYKSISNYEYVRNILSVSGMDVENANAGTAWVTQNQQIVYRSYESKAETWHTELAPFNNLMISLKLDEVGNNTSQSPNINFNGALYNKCNSGLNIFIYDTITQTVVESSYFPIINGEMQYLKSK